MPPSKPQANKQAQIQTWIDQASQHLAQGKYDQAIALYQKIYKRTQNPRAQQLMGLAYYRMDQPNQGLYHSEKAFKAYQALNVTDIHTLVNLAEISGKLGNLTQCQRYGKQVLQLKHQQALQQPFQTTVTTTHQTLPIQGLEPQHTHIVSYSLYGNSPRYGETAIHNVQAVASHLPDFRCRFYVDHSVPKAIQQRLLNAGAQLVDVTGTELGQLPGTFWRFAALDDDGIQVVLCRDADSLVSARETPLVQEWLDSDDIGHSIRDFFSHVELLLAGLFGIKRRANLTSAWAAMQAYAQQETLHSHADQYFLRHWLWPQIHDRCLNHDRLFAFGQQLGQTTLPTPARDLEHMGANQGVGNFTIQIPQAKPNHPITWHIEDPQGQVICQYEHTLQNNALNVALPFDYLQQLQAKTWQLHWRCHDPD